jgi:hypothetical protein
MNILSSIGGGVNPPHHDPVDGDVGPADADNITILTTTGHKLLAKRWQADGTIAQYDEAKQFTLSTRRVSGIDELSDLLRELERDPHSCVIRGAFRGEDAARASEPSMPLGKVFRRKTVFDDQPLHSIMIEVDEFEPILAGAREDPAGAVYEYVHTMLPAEFHENAYHWQLSNSFGHPDKPGLRAHIWFWLKTPYTSAQLRAWAKAVKLPADHSVLDTVQVHYTSAPVFDKGVSDPVAVRSGFFEGLLADEVILKIDESIAAAAVSVERPTRGEKVQHAVHSDPVAQHLFENGYVKAQTGEGKLHIICPFEDEHSGPSGESATTYFPAHTGGYAQGHFKCLHAHCADRKREDYLQKIGYSRAGEFEWVESVEPVAEATKARPGFVGELQFKRDRPRLPWFIKGVLPRGPIGVVYGASQSGKSFFTLDLVMHVARGLQWRGLRTKQARVGYIAAEGAGGFSNRLDALHAHYGEPPAGAEIAVLADAPNFRHVSEIDDLIQRVKEWGPMDIIVVDTLSQVVPGADENSAGEMSVVLGHCRRIHEVTGATVILIHHTGKDASKGMRGSSVVGANIEFTIGVVRRERGTRAAIVDKLREGKDGTEFGFQLQVELLGLDEDGDPITSCWVEHTTSGPMMQDALRRSEPVKGEVERLVLRVLHELMGLQVGAPRGEEVIKACVDQMAPPADPTKRDRRGYRAQRAFQNLLDSGRIVVTGGTVQPAGEG